MRRFLTPTLGGIALVAAVIFAACLGSSDQEKQAPEGSANAALLMMDAGYSTECPWTSDTDPTCAPGYSEKPCGSGSGRCRVSGSLGCTCVSGTSLDAGTTGTSTETTGTTSPDAGYSTECPWTSDTDPSCAPGVSERSCGGGSGQCRVSGSLGCTCVSGTTSLDAGTAL
ncbi:MAG: hypothetical protein ACXU86_21580 [Archangium sp.]